MYSSGATDDMQIIFLLLTPIYFPWGKKIKKRTKKSPKQGALLWAPPAEKGGGDVSGMCSPGMGGCGRAGCGAGQGRSGWNGSATPATHRAPHQHSWLLL